MLNVLWGAMILVGITYGAIWELLQTEPFLQPKKQ